MLKKAVDYVCGLPKKIWASIKVKFDWLRTKVIGY
jgi:hypothetical protein